MLLDRQFGAATEYLSRSRRPPGSPGGRPKLQGAELKRPKTRKDGGKVALGIAWYRESDWPRVKAEFPDADELHDTYAEWHESAESLIRHLNRNGIAAEAFAIDIDHFIGWCATHDQLPDAEARSAYVAEMLKLRRQASTSSMSSDPHP